MNIGKKTNSLICLFYHDLQVIAIGIGSGVNQAELKSIATDDAHAFTVANFNALTNIRHEIEDAACKLVLNTS